MGEVEPFPGRGEKNDHLPPIGSIEVEEALLGALLINNEAIDRVRWLMPDAFSEQVYGLVFEKIIENSTDGRRVDPRLLVPQLPPGVDWPAVLARVVASATTVVNAPDYARAIHGMSVRRSLEEIGLDMAAIARTPPKGLTSPEKQLEDAEERIAELREGSKIRAGKSMEAELDASLNAIAKAYQEQTPVGFDWCLEEIHQAIDMRMEPGDLVGLLGASGDTKTTLTLQQARYTAEQGTPVLYLSGEQSVIQCIRQLNAQALSIDARRMKDGKISEDEWARITTDTRAIGRLPLSIESWADCNVEQLKARARAFNRRYGSGLVVIDHAKKIRSIRPGDNIAERVFQIYDGLKDLAVSSGNAVLLLMQRNSEFLKREGMAMRPVRGDAYGGEGTVQNLDGCVGIFRPGRWLRERAKVERDSKATGLETKAAQMDQLAGQGGSLVELYPLKSRFGDDQGDKRDLRFEGRYTRLVSLANQDQWELI